MINCQEINSFFDAEIKVPVSREQQVQLDLDTISKILNGEFRETDEDVIAFLSKYKDLKNRKVPSQTTQVEEQRETVKQQEPEQPPAIQTETKWKCPRCATIQNLD
jgi:hypothetical protein